MEEQDAGTLIQRASEFEGQISENASACIVLLLGKENQLGRTWPVEGETFEIGRSPLCEIPLDEKSVSSKHARISSSEEEDTITDLGSTNKTLVNGVELKPNVPYTLENNDVIKMGNIVIKYLAKGNIESVAVSKTFDRSYLDPLTRVFNKGALALQGLEFYERAVIQNLPLGIASLDIDHFKKVNDTYGHSAGDYVLVEFANLVKQKYRSKDDFLARAGGEEFVLMVCRRPATQAIIQLENLRKAIESHEFIYENKKIPITVSIGYATMSPKDTCWEDVLDRSDKALYEAKNGGRNQVASEK